LANFATVESYCGAP